MKENPTETYEKIAEQKAGKFNDFNDFSLEFKENRIPIIFTKNRNDLNKILKKSKDLDFIKDQRFD